MLFALMVLMTNVSVLYKRQEYPGLPLNNIPKVTFGVLFFAVALINQYAMLLLVYFLTPLLCYS